ncbi:MAG TPA: stalk domain-containing protein [Symbiobacteriaceae bacterium]|nr:stalk domain-containing protein [Symbiobacteriaceae bacterium]
MRLRNLPGVLLLACLLILLAVPAQGADPNVGREPVSVVRITSDGKLKNGAVISANGSAVAWFQEGEGYSDLLMFAAADGSTGTKTLLTTDPKTDSINGVYGPQYKADDNLYHITLRSQHIQISADGSLIVLESTEHYSGGWLYGFIVVHTGTGEIKYVAEAYPGGMGFRAVNTYGGAQSVGEGYYAVSGDGRTILFLAEGKADNARQSLLVALDIASGQARRVAGYTSLTPQVVNEADPKGSYSGPWVSPTGAKVAFSTYSNWVTDLFVGDFGSTGGAPQRIETLQTGSTPRFTAGGEYLVARHPDTATSTFWPAEGGAPVKVEHRDAFTIPFYDGMAGLVEVPIWAGSIQEVRVIRPGAAAVMLKPGEMGLPGGWSLGVPGLASTFHWTLADAYGKRVLLSLVTADAKSQDLYVLTLQPTALTAPLRIILKIDSTLVRTGGKTVTLDVAPFVQNGRTLVPLRFIGEQLGATIGWDQAEQRVTYTKGSTVIQLWIGRQEALVDGQSFMLDVAPQVVSGRTMVPVRFVAQALGATTEWNGETSEVTITAQ